MGGKQLVGFIHGIAVLNPVDQQCIPLYLGIQGRAAADTQRLLAVVGGQAHTENQADHLVSGRDLAPIDNIVKNALDHTEKGDTVRIEWKALSSAVQIIVKDNGCGIHPEDLLHIFKRFYRSRFSKDKQGIGLGLPLAKAIIEAHNGTIEVDSQLGAGTTFTMNFLIPTKL